MATVALICATWTVTVYQERGYRSQCVGREGEHNLNALLPDALFSFQTSLPWNRWTNGKVLPDPKGSGGVFRVIPLSGLDGRITNLWYSVWGKQASQCLHLAPPFMYGCVLSYVSSGWVSSMPSTVLGSPDTILWRKGKCYCCWLSNKCWTGAGSRWPGDLKKVLH